MLLQVPLLLVILSMPVMAQSTLYVDDDATPPGNGLTWNTAFTELLDALDFVFYNPGLYDTIKVAQGTYYPDRGFGDRDWTIQILDDLSVYGGFRGLSDGGSPDDRDIINFQTILSGDIGVPGVDTDNSYNVVTASYTNSTAVMDGFFIEGGYANGSNPRNKGGGLSIKKCGLPTCWNG